MNKKLLLIIITILFCSKTFAIDKWDYHLDGKIHENNPDIVLFAETDHYSKLQPVFYLKAVELIKKYYPKFNCVLYETDPRYTEQFKKFISNESSYNDSIENFHKKLTKEMERNDDRIAKKFSITEPLAKKLRELKFDILGIDIIFNKDHGKKITNIHSRYLENPKDSENNQRYVDLLIKDRNDTMVNNINKAMSSNCDKAIGIVGSGHILRINKKHYPGYRGQTPKTIQTQLRKLGYKIMVVYLTETKGVSYFYPSPKDGDMTSMDGSDYSEIDTFINIYNSQKQ